MYNWHTSPSCRVESIGKTTSASYGTIVSTSASAHTKGDWTDIGSATTFAYEAFEISFVGPNGYAFLDIAINVSGNRFIIVPDLYFCGGNIGEQEWTFTAVMPIHVPAGSQFSARYSDSAGNTFGVLMISGFSTGFNGAPGFAYAVAMGAVVASSTGTLIDPGATVDTKGSWVELEDVTPARFGGLMAVVGNAGDVARVFGLALMDIGLGVGGSEQVVYPDAAFGWRTVLDFRITPKFGPWPADIPAGSRMAARGQCAINTAGDRTWDVVLYGFVN